MRYRNVLWVLLLGITVVSCNNSPKVIEKVNNTSEQPAQQTPREVSQQGDDAMREVIARETLNAEKYTYVLVEGSGEQYWIAVPRSDVQVGQTYFYKGGLLKKNFKSREFDREFETIYLVSGLMQKSTQSSGSAVDRALNAGNQTQPEVGHVHSSENSVSLKEIFENKSEYSGKVVEVTGECVKVNKQIMGRNWVHIQDGSAGDKPYDLTVTTSADIPVGAVVTLRGTIVLDRDFGSGYRYDVIMEDAHTH